MIEFEWESKATRAEAAALLRELANSLAGEGDLELEHDAWQLKLEVADDVELSVEAEVEGDETELEIELKWSRRSSAGAEAGDD